MKRALCGLLVLCLMALAIITASHGHLADGGRRCELCAVARAAHQPAPAPQPAPPAPSAEIAPPVLVAGASTSSDVLSYSPKNSPPAGCRL